MWALDNYTPYGAERNWIRDKTGRHIWVVAVKATFSVQPDGRLTLAEEQQPPSLAPEYAGKPGASSLRWDSDLLYAKTGTDIIAEAHAHAPGGKPRDVVPVSLRVGPMRKELVVFGNRVYYGGLSGLTTSAPAPFVTRPITYEWAYGGAELDAAKPGMDDRNPVGKGFAIRPERLEHQPAHAVEYPRGSAASAGPAGFGAIDPAWTPRRQRAGTYDADWERNRKPLLPDDFDPLYGSSAPDDQRATTALRGGEPVELRNMTPEGILSFELPRIFLGFNTRIGSNRQEHRGQLVTVLLQPEERKLALVWQSTLYVAPRDGDYLESTRILQKSSVT